MSTTIGPATSPPRKPKSTAGIVAVICSVVFVVACGGCGAVFFVSTARTINTAASATPSPGSAAPSKPASRKASPSYSRRPSPSHSATPSRTPSHSPSRTPSRSPKAKPSPKTVTTKPAAPAVPLGPPSINGDGQYLVGRDVQAGTYRTGGPAADWPFCYWERDSDASGDLSSIIANDNTAGPEDVTLNAGEYFKTSSCQTWVKVG